MLDLIPVNKLEEGFEKCRRNIEKLLKSSELLKSGRYYSSSIALSILSLEEGSKLNFIHKCVKEKRGITEKEWNEITGIRAHGKKLTMNAEERQNTIRQWSVEDYLQDTEYSKNLGFHVETSKSYEEIKIQSTLDINLLKIFNEVKKDCFYLKWNESDWFSVVTNMPEIIQKSLAYVLLELAKNELTGIVLTHKYRDENRSNPKDFEQFKNDPLLIELRNRSTSTYVHDLKKKMSLCGKYLSTNYPPPKQKK